MHACVPVGQEAADFVCGSPGSLFVDFVALRRERLPVRGPIAENAVEAQDSAKLRMIDRAPLPERGFLGIERIVGHDHQADACELKYVADVGVERLRLKEGAGFGKVGAIGRQQESFENGDDAARGFGNGCVFDEKSTPYGVGLFAFGERPILGGRSSGAAEKFGFEIVIGEQFVDPPETEFAERGSEEVRVDVDEGSGREYVFDDRKNLRYGKTVAIFSGQRFVLLFEECGCHARHQLQLGFGIEILL